MKKFSLSQFFGLLFLLNFATTDATPPNTLVATINVGITPDGLAITPDSRYGYVVNNNNYGLPGENSVTVLDLTDNSLVTTIFDGSFNEPFRITLNPAGTKAYVANSAGSTVSIIDTATNTVSGVIGGFDGPSGFAITPDGQKAYVNNYGATPGVGSGNGTTISVVDLASNTITDTITVDLAPAALAITPNGKFVYVINYVDGNPGTGTINVIRTSDNQVVATIPGFSGPFSLAITPDGNYAYVTNFGSNNFAPIGSTVSVVSLKKNKIVKTITLGIQPAGIAVSPDGRYVFATNFNTLYAGPGFTNLTPGEGTVNVIDTATNRVIPPTIVVGQSPSGVTISPNGNYVYVTNFASNTVSVISLQAFQITGQVSQLENKFLTQKDLINKITWTVTGTSTPVSYSLYRDPSLTDLIATVPGTGPLEFYDHNRKPGVDYTYYITGTNAVGTTSTPVSIPFFH